MAWPDILTCCHSFNYYFKLMYQTLALFLHSLLFYVIYRGIVVRRP